MIELKELRIGNSVSIWGEGVGWYMGRVCADDLVRISKGKGNYMSVPLSDYRLLNLGFERYQQTGHYKIASHKYYANHDPHTLRQGYMRIKLTQANNYRIESIASKSIYLKSVHQLQNVFYAITATELIYRYGRR